MRLVTFLLAIAFAAGCQGDPQKCEQAVRNYASLIYWKQADKEIAAAPPDQREAMRKDKLAEFQAQLDKGLQTLVSQCTSANNKDQVNCMIEAKTAEQAKECSGH
jgi:hypothetical protein